MKLVVLPGNSKSNREWSNEVLDVFSSISADRFAQDYSHWETGESLIDIKAESDKLFKNVGEDKCIVFAKSAGSMLTVYATTIGLMKPEKCVFFGLPVLWAEENGFDLKKLFENFNVPTLIIQNSQDPITSFSVAKEFVEGLGVDVSSGITLYETDGDDHKYDDLEKFKDIIFNFLS